MLILYVNAVPFLGVRLLEGEPEELLGLLYEGAPLELLKVNRLRCLLTMHQIDNFFLEKLPQKIIFLQL